MKWPMRVMGGLGPMAGQNHHFGRFAPDKIPYAIERYRSETSRLYGVLDGALEGRDFIADTYSIADMACMVHGLPGMNGKRLDLDEYPNVLDVGLTTFGTFSYTNCVISRREAVRIG